LRSSHVSEGFRSLRFQQITGILECRELWEL
jgi:hypothetical protein